jgi:phosphate-selective porin OprO/OprP
LQSQQADRRDGTVQPAAFANDSFPCQNCNQPSAACSCRAANAGAKKAGDGFPTVKLTGFFQLDLGFSQQSPNNRATLGDIADNLDFRRVRFAATGNVAENTSYIAEFDIAQTQPRFVDVWMQFASTQLGNIRIGRFRQPFGMTDLTSIRELPFLERPLPFALNPFRQTGIMLFDTALDDQVTWAVSGFRHLSDNFGNVYADNGGYGMATRLTMLPIDGGDELLVHLGCDYSYHDPGRDLVQYAYTNEFFGGQNPLLGPASLSVLPIDFIPPFVNTGQMPTQRTNLFNVEGAFSLGRLLFQSEGRWSQVDLLSGERNTFPSAYAHVRYVLTGEVIPYNRKAGVFGRVKPARPVNLLCGDFGAWELAARGSYMDLNGVGLPGPGRRLTDATLGLNWYVNDYTKFQFNWINSDLDDPTRGDSSAQTYALRGQIDY